MKPFNRALSMSSVQIQMNPKRQSNVKLVTRAHQRTILLFIMSAAQNIRNKSVRALNPMNEVGNPAHTEDGWNKVYYRKEAIPITVASSTWHCLTISQVCTSPVV